MGPGLWGHWGLGGDWRHKGMEGRGMRGWGIESTGEWGYRGLESQGDGSRERGHLGTRHFAVGFHCLFSRWRLEVGQGGRIQGQGTRVPRMIGDTWGCGTWGRGHHNLGPGLHAGQAPPASPCNELNGLSLGLEGIPGATSALGGAVSPPLPPMQVPGEVPSGAVRAGLPGEL